MYKYRTRSQSVGKGGGDLFLPPNVAWNRSNHLGLDLESPTFPCQQRASNEAAFFSSCIIIPSSSLAAFGEKESICISLRSTTECLLKSQPNHPNGGKTTSCRTWFFDLWRTPERSPRLPIFFRIHMKVSSSQMELESKERKTHTFG